jgi:hypothetical protein
VAESHSRSLPVAPQTIALRYGQPRHVVHTLLAPAVAEGFSSGELSISSESPAESDNGPVRRVHPVLDGVLGAQDGQFLFSDHDLGFPVVEPTAGSMQRWRLLHVI